MNTADRYEKFVKRVNYAQVRIATIGGTIEIKPSAEGWKATFEPAPDQPRTAFSQDLAVAGQQLINDMRYMVDAVEADIKAFIERNK